VSERERFYIEGMYYQYATGELEKAVQVLTEYVQAYPNDADAHANLASTYYILGQIEKSEKESREAFRLNPDDGFNAGFLMADELILNHYDKTKAVYEEGRARGLENGFPETLMYYLAFFQGDTVSMQHYFDATMGQRNGNVFLVEFFDGCQVRRMRPSLSVPAAPRAKKPMPSPARNAIATNTEMRLIGPPWCPYAMNLHLLLIGIPTRFCHLLFLPAIVVN
jgi:tetratricopeptide (TPR) repeat protein